jgi:hypothetical protein
MSEHIDRHGDVWRLNGVEATRIEAPVLIFSASEADARYGPFKPPLPSSPRCPTCGQPMPKEQP